MSTHPEKTAEAMEPSASTGSSGVVYRMELDGFDELLAELEGLGYEVLGPTVQDGAITWGKVARRSDLPVGLTDVQEGGKYRVAPLGAPLYFGYAVGPRSLKNYLYPSRRLLFRVEGTRGEFHVEIPESDIPAYAFVGVRPCELAAMAIQDTVFMYGTAVESEYAARRRKAFFVTVNCTHPAATCFCASLGTGPEADAGGDIILTEVYTKEEHFFTARSVSPAGQSLLQSLGLRAATVDEIHAAAKGVDAARAMMQRALDKRELKEALYAMAQHPHWEEVSQRCLACGNCTLVCPTCFCSTVEDTISLDGTAAERWRRWDSCYSLEFSYVHGGSTRKSGAARYRQWLTHKLGSWQDQFGTVGCVGCGRCITWCPVGIDLTEEARYFQEQYRAQLCGGKTS